MSLQLKFIFFLNWNHTLSFKIVQIKIIYKKAVAFKNIMQYYIKYNKLLNKEKSWWLCTFTIIINFRHFSLFFFKDCHKNVVMWIAPFWLCVIPLHSACSSKQSLLLMLMGNCLLFFHYKACKKVRDQMKLCIRIVLIVMIKLLFKTNLTTLLQLKPHIEV